MRRPARASAGRPAVGCMCAAAATPALPGRTGRCATRPGAAAPGAHTGAGAAAPAWPRGSSRGGRWRSRTPAATAPAAPAQATPGRRRRGRPRQPVHRRPPPLSGRCRRPPQRTPARRRPRRCPAGRARRAPPRRRRRWLSGARRARSRAAPRSPGRAERRGQRSAGREAATARPPRWRAGCRPCWPAAWPACASAGPARAAGSRHKACLQQPSGVPQLEGRNLLACRRGLRRTGCAPKAVGRPSAASAAASSASTSKAGALARSARAAGASRGSPLAADPSCMIQACKLAVTGTRVGDGRSVTAGSASAHLLASALALWCPLHSAMHPLRSERLAARE